MSVLLRDDGVRFSLYTYRDVLYASRSSLLRQEISELQHENGDYARFFELDSGEIEVVFSHEPGYLLAESVSHYFEQSDNLIYCEQISGQENAVLIIIKEGMVFLDALLPISLLVDEFFSLTSHTHIQYSVYAYGDIPLGTDKHDEKFVFPKEMVRSLNWLDEPLIPRIEPNAAFQLIPVQDAFDALTISKSKLPNYLMISLSIVVIGFLMYQLLKPKEVIVPIEPPPKPIYVDPYADYKKALSQPTAEKVIFAVDREVEGFMGIPGWQVTNVRLSGDRVTASLEQEGGSADILLALLAKRNLVLEIDRGKATISAPIQLTNQTDPKKIYYIRSLVAHVYDRLRLLVDANNIKLKDLVVGNNYVVQNMSVDIVDMTPSMIDLFGKEFKNFPIIIEDIDFSLSEGFISGTINFSVLGATQK